MTLSSLRTKILTMILTMILGWAALCLMLPAARAQQPAARAQQPAAHAQQQDQAALLAGVTEIAAPGLPGPLCVFGPQAFPVVVGKAGKDLTAPVVAASRWGRGRVVAFAHPSYLEQEALGTADTGKLVLNAIRWMGPGERPAHPLRGERSAHPLRVGVRQHPDLIAYLTRQGVQTVSLEGGDWPGRLDSCDVVCCPTSALSDPEINALTAYIQQGGGLLAAELGWGWLQLNPGKTLLQHGGNRLFRQAGLVWADGTLDRTTAQGYRAADTPSALCQADAALAVLVAATEGDTKRPPAEIAQAVWTVTAAVRTLPSDDKILLPRLIALQQKHRGDFDASLRKPITSAQPLARLLFTLQLEALKNLPAEQVQPHPAASLFPGSVPADAPRIRRSLELDTSVPAWHSTGLYAAPGERIVVEAPQQAVGKNLRVRIGAHTDTLWHLETWKRAPEITRSFPLQGPHTVAANAFGGPIYIEVPANCKLGVISLTIRDAVEAPYYVRGKTDLAAWRAQIRHLPAPWAELQANHVILTVPSASVRSLDDPEALMAYWDDLFQNCTALYAAPPRLRPERYCVDRQISAGYMHSGYPIMTGEDVAGRFTDLSVLRGKDGRPDWGFYHELGHNFQVRDWTFSGTGEVTNNLNSLYCCEKLNGIPADNYGLAHSALEPQKAQQRLQNYLASGASFAAWKQDPFLALTMYIQLRQAFGWDAYQKVFAEYRPLTAEQRPKNDDEERDQWMVRFSRTVGKNLGPFFQTWGVPTSEKARASIQDLPLWMPPNFPPK